METMPAKVSKFNNLLNLEKIEKEHLKDLSREDRNEFIGLLYDTVNTLTDIERDAFIEKAGSLLDNEAIWECNHSKIMQAIDKYIKEYGCVPNKSYISLNSGLSRKTVHEHLKTFSTGKPWQDAKDSLDLMTEKVKAAVLRSALQGDMKAARLFLEVQTRAKVAETTVNNQNNFIQINKTIINQQVLQQLKPEQLQLIEKIIAGEERKELAE